VQTQPLHIEGLAGPLVLTVNSITGGHSIIVGDQPAEKTGRSAYLLPTGDGEAVEAKLHRTRLGERYPVLEIDGVEHPTGPPVPSWLRIMALLPLLSAAFGPVQAVIAVAGVLLNFQLLSMGWSSTVKTLMVIGVAAVAVTIGLGVFAGTALLSVHL